VTYRPTYLEPARDSRSAVAAGLLVVSLASGLLGAGVVALVWWLS